MGEPAEKHQLPLAKAGPKRPASDEVTDAVSSKESHALVVALAGHVGAGPSHVGRKIESELKNRGFAPVYIKLSELIREAAEARGRTMELSLPHKRTSALQSAGGHLRREFGSSVAAGLAIREILLQRTKVKGTPAFILDSLKHPAELDLLRSVYKTSFYLIGVVCHDTVRKKRLDLKYKDADSKTVEDIKALDEEDEANEGQQVRRLLHLADFFISNDATAEAIGPDLVADELARFVKIVTASEVERPTRDERGMFAAWSASLRSSCLSRQVGAALMNEAGMIIGTGVNEVPKSFGGTYDDESTESNIDENESVDPVPTGRCYHWRRCFNDGKKDEIYDEVIRELRPFLKSENRKELVSALKATRIASLTEFSRAVHAEMDALISIARLGGPSVQGATLYCRTYPCHNCARHIVAAGIREVVYVEPYRKSLATELHADSILETTKRANDASRHVHFRLFSGVAPSRYGSLFQERRNLKRGPAPPAPDANHKEFIHSISHLEFEKQIAEKVDELLGELENK